MMNIYLLEDENIELGYSEFLIVANNEEEARTMAYNEANNHTHRVISEVKRWINGENSCVKIGNDENIYDAPKIITYKYEEEKW